VVASLTMLGVSSVRYWSPPAPDRQRVEGSDVECARDQLTVEAAHLMLNAVLFSRSD
jgi:hypothetical protein